MPKKQVVILAGGKATRMYPKTLNTPKSLLLVAGKPFILWQLDLLEKQKVDEVVLCLGYLGEKIKELLGDSYQNMKIKYSFEDSNNLLGTGGAIKKAEKLLAPFFGLLYGDSYLEIDYNKVFEHHINSKSPVTMTVWNNSDKFDKSNIELSEDQKKVSCYQKKCPERNFEYIDFGFTVLDKKMICSMIKKGEKAALDNIQSVLAQREQVSAYKIDHRFFEIGSKNGLIELEEHFKK